MRCAGRGRDTNGGRLADELAAALAVREHPLRTRFAHIQQSRITQLSQPHRNLAEMAAVVETLAFERAGAYERRAERLAFVRGLTFEAFAPWAVTCLRVDTNARRGRVEFVGLERASRL